LQDKGVLIARQRCTYCKTKVYLLQDKGVLIAFFYFIYHGDTCI